MIDSEITVHHERRLIRDELEHTFNTIVCLLNFRYNISKVKMKINLGMISTFTFVDVFL